MGGQATKGSTREVLRGNRKASQVPPLHFLGLSHGAMRKAWDGETMAVGQCQRVHGGAEGTSFPHGTQAVSRHKWGRQSRRESAFNDSVQKR